MLDPVILAVIVVVISVIGAAFFLLGSKGVENKAKKGDQIQPSKVATPPASSASTEAAASSNSTFRVKIPEIPIREVGKGKATEEDRVSQNETETFDFSENDQRDKKEGSEPSQSSGRDHTATSGAEQEIVPATKESPAEEMSPKPEEEEVEMEIGVRDEAHFTAEEFPAEILAEGSMDSQQQQEEEQDQERPPSSNSADGGQFDDNNDENGGDDGASNDLMEPSARLSEDCGEGRCSLTLDIASVQKGETPRGPNSLQRHDSQRSERASSPMRTPSGKLSTAGAHSVYKRGGGSWIKNTNTEASAAAASPVSVTPVRHSLPKKIIPVSDDQQPLALRQGNKINEYESGLLAEKEKVSSRVQETRRRNITDVVARVLLDGDATQVPAELDPTQLLLSPSPDVRKKAIVKQMAMKFSSPAGGAGSSGSSGSNGVGDTVSGVPTESPRDAAASEASVDSATSSEKTSTL